MYSPDPPSRKNLLLVCPECCQQVPRSCSPLRGFPQLHGTASTTHTSSWGCPYPVVCPCKAQSCSPAHLGTTLKVIPAPELTMVLATAACWTCITNQLLPLSNQVLVPRALLNKLLAGLITSQSPREPGLRCLFSQLYLPTKAFLCRIPTKHV